ncbi:membrane-associated, metal-dependent hydrolase [Legionella oakridgensis]|nr:membrane-associated, metal-dependent hydrolase [Legionella oakridgensis]
MLSYNRFVEVKKSALLSLIYFIYYQSKTKTGIYFVDSTTISVCHVKRANSNKVFQGFAKKSKSTMGWDFALNFISLLTIKANEWRLNSPSQSLMIELSFLS